MGFDSNTLKKIRGIVYSDKDVAAAAGRAAGGAVFARRADRRYNARLNGAVAPGTTATVATIAKALNCDPSDGAAMLKALKKLLASAAVDTSGDDDNAPDPSDDAPPDSSDDGSIPEQVG